MSEPDFSEGQLQQMINTEIFNYLRRNGHPDPVPIVIPPFWEERWGWDTGIYFPWYGPRNLAQRGCNFFIQYKLSKTFVSSGALGWNAWRQEFLRFNLGYRRKSQWDFQQRDHLIELARSGFSVIYLTNHVLAFSELVELAMREQLCANLPALEVSADLNKHAQVSFTKVSDKFCLHSEKEWASKRGLLEIIDQVQETALNDDLDKIIAVLKRFEESLGIKEQSLEQTFSRFKAGDRKDLKIFIVGSFLRKYLDLFWFRF